MSIIDDYVKKLAECKAMEKEMEALRTLNFVQGQTIEDLRGQVLGLQSLLVGRNFGPRPGEIFDLNAHCLKGDDFK